MAVVFYKWLMICSWWLTTPTLTEQPVSKHPFYLAVTEINLNTSDKTLGITCKMFADDLEQVLEKNNHTQLDISSAKDQGNFNKYIPAYIKQHLSISIDGKPSTFSYIGFEKENESAYCYFEVENIASLKNLEITNSLLHDLTIDQVNIIHVTVKGKRQSTKLNHPQKNASFNF